MSIVRYIEAPRSLRMSVAKELGISESAVNRALRYKRDGELSAKARNIILDSGQAVVMNALPECETIHVCDGTMHQVFGNELKLIIDMNTGVYKVYNADSDPKRDRCKFSSKVDDLRGLAQVQAYLADFFNLEDRLKVNQVE